jgi:hypothetical protein
MNKIKYIIAVIMIGAVSFFPITIPQVFALGNTDVELSKPIGGDILPGGGNKILDAKTIQDSFIFTTLLPFLITYAIRITAVLSVIALIFGGYQYLTAYGVEEKHDLGRKTITYALLGLILSITAYGIVKIITAIKFT